MIERLKSILSLVAAARMHKGSLLYALIALLAVVLYFQGVPGLDRMELSYEDYMRSGADLIPDSGEIAVVGIDTRSIVIVGDWPWDHEKISDLLVTICDCRPRAVMLDFPLAEKMEEFISGTSAQLATSIRECGNIVIPFDIVVASQGKLSRSAPAYFRDFAISSPRSANLDRVPVAAAAFVPPEIFATGAAGVGFNYYETDADDKVRRADLLVNYEGFLFPSASLELAAAYLGESHTSLKLDRNHLLLDGREIPIDDEGRLLLRFPAEGRLYPTYSAIDVLTGSVKREDLSGKAVIIAATNPAQCTYLQTATAGQLAAHTYSAAVVQQIISGTSLTHVNLPLGGVLTILLLLSVAAALFLPRFRLSLRLVASIVAAAGIVIASLLMFQAFSLLIPIVYPLTAILLIAIVSPFVKQIEVEEVQPTGKKSSLAPERTLRNEPVAIDRDSNEEITESEIPRRVMQDGGKPRESYSETVRLDFEAVQRSLPDYRTGKGSDKADEKIEIDLSDADSSQPNQADKDFESTRVISTDMLPDNMQPPVEKEATTSATSEGPDSDSMVLQTMEQALAPESQDDKNEVKFSADGKPVSFGRYLVVGPVGSGAMGTVYKGRDPAIDRSVALKTIRFDSIASSSEVGELKERLIREAKAAGNLSHPNIVTIYDVGVQANLQYIAMEFIDGYTLEALLTRNLELNYRIVADIVKQVCSALDYAHNSGIIHRDIKPANIMVMESFRVKVMDFGIAHVKSSSITQTGVAMGTPSYISPELLQGHDVTPATDIYSLGVVLYELLTRRKPFVAENISSLIYKIINEQPLAPTSVDDRIPALFDHIIKKAMAKKPQDRYQSAKEFDHALEDFTYSMRSKHTVT
jgi:CHASE2 domain-containing sensor protein/predicted Ser/Thr protein kinase